MQRHVEHPARVRHQRQDMKDGSNHGPEAMRTERERCRSGYAKKIDRQMPHVERRKLHWDVVVQDPICTH